MTAVVVSGARVEAGGRTILGPIDVSIEPRTWTTIVGRSGAGKTTFLRLIAGLARPTAGRVALFGEPVSDGARILVPPERRGVGLVFQGGGAGLWPHMSVARTLDFVLSCARVPSHERAARVAQLIEAVELGPCRDRRPGELSGGEAQRLSLARALANRPRLLLLDEPLGPLDAELRASMVERVRVLHREFGLTTIQVTHDPHEVEHVTDRTLRLDAGTIVSPAG